MGRPISRAVRRQKIKELQPAARSGLQAEPSGLAGQRVSLALMILALVYAFLACVHTVFDFDMGWHLATGRWVVQHHAVPSTDVLSYTSPGAEWLYPPFAGVLLYGVFSAWGYAGLSWFCALVLVATVACLLRNPSRPESGLTAAFAVMAVPALAYRAHPRADLFSPLFFAVFLVLLWDFFRSGAGDPEGEGAVGQRRQHLRLWILPASMLLWVNLHPGFIAGLGLVFAYLLIEGLEMLLPMRREAALERLRLAWPALAATFCATLINPYGPRIFKASLLLSGLGAANRQINHIAVVELAPLPLSFGSLAQSLDWRSPDSSFWWLALVGVVAIAVAALRRQLGAALLMAAVLYGTAQHQRYKSLLVIVVAVVGASILTGAPQDGTLQNERQGSTKVAAKRTGLWSWWPAIAASVLFLVTCVRIVDLVSSRSYIVDDAETQFGVGESWWYPERAADFVEREHLPGHVFQVYNMGGFTAWRLGPAYGDFIDGRNVAPEVLTEEQDLLWTSPDSAVWQEEADRRGINFLFLSLARFSGIGSPDLTALCRSKEWRPVYMDEVSIVLLRNRTENRPWIDRYGVDCQTYKFVPPVRASRIDLSTFYANAGNVLLYLGRWSEAKQALDQAVALSPEDPSVHLALAQFFEQQKQPGDAEREYKTSVSLGGELDNLENAWIGLGLFYYSHGRYGEARQAILAAEGLSSIPVSEHSLLGAIDLGLRQPQDALMEFAEAEEIGNRYWQPEDMNRPLFAQIAEGRAAVYAQLGDLQRAIDFEQVATQKTPENAGRWKSLGDLYQRVGQSQLAEQAHERASALSQ